MKSSTLPLLAITALTALLGVVLISLTNSADAMVTASTGGVYGALVQEGLEENIPLRNALYGVVMRLREPWGIVQLIGLALSGLGLMGLALTLRRRNDRQG